VTGGDREASADAYWDAVGLVSTRVEAVAVRRFVRPFLKSNGLMPRAVEGAIEAGEGLAFEAGQRLFGES
jgi:hypothetical protein